MFTVAFYKDYLNDKSDRVVVGIYQTLLAAMLARQVNGDLVVDDNGEIIKSTFWLWKWERADLSCYARRMQRSSGG